MNKHEHEKELRRTILVIALLTDANEKFEHVVRVMDPQVGNATAASPFNAQDLSHLKRKKKYLEFILKKDLYA